MKIAGRTHATIQPNTMQRKELIPSIYYVQSLIQFYLTDGATTTFIQKPKRNTSKDPLTDKEVRLDHLGLYGTGPGRPNGSRETVAGYLHPRGASVVGELSPALSS